MKDKKAGGVIVTKIKQDTYKGKEYEIVYELDKDFDEYSGFIPKIKGTDGYKEIKDSNNKSKLFKSSDIKDIKTLQKAIEWVKDFIDKDIPKSKENLSKDLINNLKSLHNSEEAQKYLNDFVDKEKIKGDALLDLMYDIQKEGFHNLKKPRIANIIKKVIGKLNAIQ